MGLSIREWLVAPLCALSALLLCNGSALAWTRPGHMVTAAIAYDELMTSDPKIVDRIIEIMASHPEPAPFQVAIGRELNTERSQRIFLEIPRWADDVRGGEYSHPTWHYAIRPVIDREDPPSQETADVISGSAFEALALNIDVAKDPRAAASERAVALCWIFHIVGDIHQPLHTGELHSRQFPDGDFGGDKFYLLDPKSGQPVKLHWFWDDAVHDRAEPEAALERARALMAKLPRARFAKELARDRKHPADIQNWAAESYAVAKSVAYRADRPRAISPDQAKRPSDAYVTDSIAVAEQRLTVAGYRLTDVLRMIFSNEGAAPR